MRLLRSFMMLSSGERRLLLGATLLSTAVQLALGRLPFTLLRRLVTRGRRSARRSDHAMAEQVVWAVTAVSRRAPGRATCLNPLRVADHLVGLFDDRTSTFYRDIYRLPPGHTLTVGGSGTRLRPYWALDATRELVLDSDDAYAEAFRECFTEAVRCRLRSDPPAGSLLSGGLDTSSIVGVARQLGGMDGKHLDTFTAVFPGLPAADLRRIDERGYVDAVVGQGGIDAHYVRGDLLSPLADVDRVLWHLDEAHAAPNLYLHWALYGAARDQGVRALLDGIDGDTIVSHGLERLPGLARSGRVMMLGRELRALSERHGARVRDLLWRFGIHPLLPLGLRHAVRRMRRRRESALLAHSVIRPEFAREMGVLERLEASEARNQRPARTPGEAHRRAMESGLIQHALEMADKTAAAFAVEPRYPFLDRRLMELCLAIPADQKLRGGWTRSLMRRAMRGILPEEVRWRPTKANLAPNFTRRLLAQDRAFLSGILLGEPEVIEQFVDTTALRHAYERCVAGPTTGGDAETIHAAVVLARWLQRTKLTA